MSVAISVVIPAYNASATLGTCLEHLSHSAFRPLEIIVVDDGSTDDTVEIARKFGGTVLTTGERRGPARARNLAAAQARGDVLLFLDADVTVYPDTIERIARSFDADPALDALIGSYDDSPASPDFVSQYKNLMHCYVHQTGRHEASTFWSGCGAIRRAVFFEHSGFSEDYRRPAIEDIELGYRFKRAGRKILLDPEVQVKHLKRWTFWGLVKSDILDRGIPWTELILRDRNMPNDLNLQLSQRVTVALTYVAFGIGLICAFQWRGYFLAPLFLVLFFLLGRYWVDGTVTRSRTVQFFMTVSIGLILWLSYANHLLGLIPLMLAGLLLLVLQHRYALNEENRWLRRWMAVPFILVTVVTVAIYLPAHPLVFVLGLILLALILLNNQFYVFLAAREGRLFALASIPFHLLYHFYNGISFGAGLCRWVWLTRAGRKPGVLFIHEGKR